MNEVEPNCKDLQRGVKGSAKNGGVRGKKPVRRSGERGEEMSSKRAIESFLKLRTFDYCCVPRGQGVSEACRPNWNGKRGGSGGVVILVATSTRSKDSAPASELSDCGPNPGRVSCGQAG